MWASYFKFTDLMSQCGVTTVSFNLRTQMNSDGIWEIHLLNYKRWTR
jgi:hypothetical protein